MLVVTMTNDQDSNEIKIYDAESHALLQTLSTHGKGGVGGKVFRRDGDALTFEKVIQTTGAPVSVDFGNDHLYVAGTTAGVICRHRSPHRRNQRITWTSWA